MKSQMYCLLSLIIIQLCFTASSFGSEAADESKGYFKIGLGYRNVHSAIQDRSAGLTVSLEGRYQWENGLFVEMLGGSHKFDTGIGSDISAGYNFYNTESWHFDVLSTFAHPRLHYSVKTPTESTDIKRDADYRIGFRATGQFDNTTVQLSMSPISLNSDIKHGVYASAYVAQNWQVKNWNFYASGGMQYQSAKINDYYFGVSEAEAITGTPTYEADGGINFVAQIGTSYPISENWVFEAYIKQTVFDDTIIDSPLVQNPLRFNEGRQEQRTDLSFLINYVF